MARAAKKKSKMSKTPRTSKTKYWFDEAAAQRVVNFFQWFLKHSKGRFAGKPFELAPWQVELLRTAYGWKRENGTRRYREVYLFLPRKNGKSTLAAGIALYHLIADGEAGAEVYSAATDKDQAKLVFTEAKRMVQADPDLSGMVEIYKASMVVPETVSGYQVLSGIPGNKDGLNISCAVIDELHMHKSRELYDVLKTATGARDQPMLWSLTTAGKAREGICWEVHERATRLLKGEIEDDEFLPVIYGADETDDWESEETWKKANPNYGTSLNPDYVRSQYQQAKNTPAYEAVFKRYHLNIWGVSEKSWLSMVHWDKGGVPVDAQSLRGRRCFVGLDLSRKIDLSAAVALFPLDDNESYAAVPRIWMPKDNIEIRERRDKVPYSDWVRQGLVEATPGNVIDHAYIQRQIVAWGGMYEIVEMGYDPWGGDQLAIELESAYGVTVVEVPMTLKHLSAPSKKLEELVLNGQLHHGGHPVLRWAAGNVICDVDANENIRPSKRKSTQRIDPIVALIIALSRAILAREQSSAYENRGIEVL